MMPFDRWLNSILLKLRALFRQDEVDAELDEELADHVEHRTDELIARGLSQAEARRQALIAMGGVAQLAEECRDRRGVAFLNGLGKDLHYALRILRQNPGFTVVTALVLALGIGSTTAMYTVVDRVLLRPLDLPRPDRLVSVGAFYPSEYDPIELWGRNRSLDALSRVRTGGVNFGAGERVERVNVAEATDGFFPVVEVQPALGSSFATEDDSVVLSHSFWHSHYHGDPGVLGETVRLNGFSYTVTGVMPEGFAYPEGVVLWASQSNNRDSRLGLAGIRMIARIRDGVSFEQADQEQRALSLSIAEEVMGATRARSAVVRGLSPLAASLSRAYQVPLLMLLAAAVFVLLIGCANAANLILARAIRRRHEIAVRACLGAGRWRVARQLLTESMVLGLAGGVTGIAIAWAGLRLIPAIAPAGTPNINSMAIDWRIALFAAGVSVLTGLLAGLVPALQTFSSDLSRGLTSRQLGDTSGSAGRRLRGALVVAEIALALVLVTGANLAIRSVANFTNLDFGFEPENVLTAEVGLPSASYQTPESRALFQARLLESASSIPGVTAAAATWILPHAGGGRGLYVTQTNSILRGNWIAGDYFRAMGIPMVAGQAFTPSEGSETPVVIINQMLARQLWGDANPIGRQIEVQGARPDFREVVGVAADIRGSRYTGSPTENPPEPEFYLPDTNMGIPVLVVRSAADPAALTETLRKTLASVETEATLYNVRTMQHVLYDAAASPRFRARLFGTFALLALLLAVLGVYGVVSYATACRTQEIGVRISLGAQNRDIRQLVVRQGLWMAVAGVVIGVLLSLGLTRLMANLLFGLQPGDPATHAAAAATMLVAVVAASLLPARRAARIDPVAALKQE